MNEITIHTGSQGDVTTIHFEWFDENNSRLTNTVHMLVTRDDKPRQMHLLVDDEVYAILCGRTVTNADTARGDRFARLLSEIGGWLGSHVRTDKEQEILTAINAALEPDW